MMFYLYSVLFALFLLGSLPWILFKIIRRNKFRRGILERFGRIPGISHLSYGSRRIWIHASSVGEVMVAVPIIKKLRDEDPDIQVVLSVITDTGYAIARDKIPNLNIVFQAPLDFHWIVKKVLRKIRPECLVIIETELWPHLIRSTNQQKIPIILLNGRISDRSFPRYRKTAFFFEPVLNCMHSISAQSRTDAERFIKLGAQPAIVSVSGNVKYDLLPDPIDPNRRKILSESLGWSEEARWIVAGSTHEGEEKALCDLLNRLKKDHDGIKLILVPRHVERVPDIQTMIDGFNLNLCQYSMIDIKRTGTEPDGLLVDTMGELMAFYSMADLVFVGGSLIDIGGHNVLEPAAVGKPVVFGPYTQNFRDAVNQLLGKQAAIQVPDTASLYRVFDELLKQPDRSAAMGIKAREVMTENTGAVDRSVKRILSVLPERNERPVFHNRSSEHKGGDTRSRLLHERLFSRPITTRDTLLQGFSLMLSPVYSLVVRVRNAGYSNGFIRINRSEYPVISIGNLTVGGTGKTPLTIVSATLLKSMGRKPGILTRGYGGRRGGVPEAVPPDGTSLEWGDEPVMISKQLPDVPVIVSRDRYRGAKWAARRMQCDCFIMDDGYQHHRLARDLNILVMDARKPLMDEQLLPAGRLREPVCSLSRADAVVFSHTESAYPPPGDLDLIQRYNPNAGIFIGRHVLKGLRWACTNRMFALDLKGVPCGILSGIADPLAFRQTVENLGVTVCREFRFPDHHHLSPSDWNQAVSAVQESGGDYLFITAKDEARLPGTANNYSIPILVVDVAFTVHPEEEYRDLLGSICPGS
jgi:3-deoxy-D-manno-octulosonic-acid transferase